MCGNTKEELSSGESHLRIERGISIGLHVKDSLLITKFFMILKILKIRQQKV